LWLADYRLAC
jgi:hypothetical protein